MGVTTILLGIPLACSGMQPGAMPLVGQAASDEDQGDGAGINDPTQTAPPAARNTGAGMGDIT